MRQSLRGKAVLPPQIEWRHRICHDRDRSLDSSRGCGVLGLGCRVWGVGFREFGIRNSEKGMGNGHWQELGDLRVRAVEFGESVTISYLRTLNLGLDKRAIFKTHHEWVWGVCFSFPIHRSSFTDYPPNPRSRRDRIQNPPYRELPPPVRDRLGD